MQKCACFKPNLPAAGKKGGQDQLVDFTNIVISVESSEAENQYDSSNYQMNFLEAEVAAVPAAPSAGSSFNNIVDKVSSTAKDLYKGVHEKAD
jgi:hypothetical protein